MPAATSTGLARSCLNAYSPIPPPRVIPTKLERQRRRMEEPAFPREHSSPTTSVILSAGIHSLREWIPSRRTPCHPPPAPAL